MTDQHKMVRYFTSPRLKQDQGRAPHYMAQGAQEFKTFLSTLHHLRDHEGSTNQHRPGRCGAVHGDHHLLIMHEAMSR